ncbi:Hypothetical protein NATL1_16281 [Prochlorococcus marinus str. NATL1A]|uniref:Uncharacterized protein n=1 Tax=Prochlorococcus marinus (strain NATL1A) TaxID=167555 RepID=A2C3X5_PROM1|nr:hypothetical protein [Prochlorococcus marinus]ABM76185.1 Hypothetical protein NATL1_16281 [Prochlorococcus marinus str. NATL1A]
MIPFIRSLSELMAITESRDNQKNVSQYNESYSSTVDSGQRKRYINSLNKKEIDLPDLPKIIRHKWIKNKISISKFIDDLDYNNQIQSSYDLTLIERQNKKTQQDVA